MQAQQQIWQQQYDKADQIPILTTTTPNAEIISFWESYGSHFAADASAIDLGCGQGRHTLYLAEQGLTTYGVDYIASAVEVLRERVREHNLQALVHARVMSLSEVWDFGDASFDLALDVYTSINIETLAAREAFRAELVRTLKPGGWFVILVPSADDEIEIELRQAQPGPEANSSFWPQTNKFQKSYSEAELRDFYGMLDEVKIETITRPATKLGRTYEARILMGVFRKKA